MTPQEKAKELVDKHRDTTVSFLSDNMKDMNAKKCALIAVDEVIEHIGDHTYLLGDKPRGYEFWREVKQEIEKL